VLKILNIESPGISLKHIVLIKQKQHQKYEVGLSVPIFGNESFCLKTFIFYLGGIIN